MKGINSDTLIEGVFENIIEFDKNNSTVRCLKISEELDVFPQSPIRMFLDDAADYFSKLIIFNSGVTLEALLENGGRNDEFEEVFFKIACGETEYHFVGTMLCGEGISWLCFRKVDTILSGFGNGFKETSNIPEKADLPVYVKTFGFFDVYKNGEALLFHCEKSKELLAMIVDRQGGYVSSTDGAAMLWPDEKVSSVLRARYRKVAMRLNETLRDYGIEDIILTVNGKRKIVPEKIRCDLFEFKNDGNRMGTGFKGEYMLNYSWGEITRKILSES